MNITQNSIGGKCCGLVLETKKPSMMRWIVTKRTEYRYNVLYTCLCRSVLGEHVIQCHRSARKGTGSGKLENKLCNLCIDARCILKGIHTSQGQNLMSNLHSSFRSSLCSYLETYVVSLQRRTTSAYLWVYGSLAFSSSLSRMCFTTYIYTEAEISGFKML